LAKNNKKAFQQQKPSQAAGPSVPVGGGMVKDGLTPRGTDAGAQLHCSVVSCEREARVRTEEDFYLGRARRGSFMKSL
jgi:hypothetical protein